MMNAQILLMLQSLALAAAAQCHPITTRLVRYFLLVWRKPNQGFKPNCPSCPLWLEDCRPLHWFSLFTIRRYYENVTVHTGSQK